MNKLITRLAIASAFVFQIMGASTASVAAPITATSFSGSVDVGAVADLTLPASLLAAQGYALHRLTNDQVNLAVTSISPHVVIGGFEANQFIVPTISGSPCRLGCFVSLDMEALHAALDPTVEIAGIAVSMFQVGRLNEGRVTFRQGLDQEETSFLFGTESRSTLRYVAGVLPNPDDLAGLQVDIGFFVGNDAFSRGLWAEAYYLTRVDVRSVPEPGTAGLAFMGAAGIGFVRLLVGARGPRRGRRG